MSEQAPPLDRQALAALREKVKAMRQIDPRSLPLPQLLELAAAAPLGAGITIDFEASHELGHEMIVVRMPVQDGGSPAVDARLAKLSRRELEVAALIAAGLTNLQIAGRLFIAECTVKDHVHKIFQKTGLPNRAALASAFRGNRP
jgi:DNA-binding NarL/FixJ family response regulator